MVSFWSGDRSRVVRRRRVSARRRPIAPSRAFDAARALRSRAFSLRSASIVLSSFDSTPASDRSVSRRATSACKEGTSLSRAIVSSTGSTCALTATSTSLSLREATSAQRSSSARASAASARARSRSHCDRQSRGARSGTDTGDNRTLPSTRVKPVPKSSSRTTMRTTIAHGKSRYQQKDSTLWGLASTWEIRLTGPIPGLTVPRPLRN